MKLSACSLILVVCALCSAQIALPPAPPVPGVQPGPVTVRTPKAAANATVTVPETPPAAVTKPRNAHIEQWTVPAFDVRSQVLTSVTGYRIVMTNTTVLPFSIDASQDLTTWTPLFRGSWNGAVEFWDFTGCEAGFYRLKPVEK